MVDFHSLLPKGSREAHVDWAEEGRKDRLLWTICCAGVPFIIVAIFHQNLTTIMALQAYFLTSIEFGLVFFVAEWKNIRTFWLIKALAASVILHGAVLSIVFSWDKANPELAVKGLALTGVLFLAGMIELYLMLWIVELFRPSEDRAKT